MQREEFEAIAERYLAECFARTTPPHVNELAATAGYSTPLFSRLFLTAVGQRPSDYLKARQLERAKQLLRTTNLAVEKVAQASGYGTDATLYRVFRVATGSTPGQFRQRR